MKNADRPSKILCMSTFPPTTCGIATYTTDTMQAIERKFRKSFQCEALEIVKGQNPASPIILIRKRNKNIFVSPRR